jgi:hypothetical protein
VLGGWMGGWMDGQMDGKFIFKDREFDIIFVCS